MNSLLMSVILQMCPTGGGVEESIDLLLSFEFVRAFTCTYAFSAGFLVVGLLVYGGISISIYARTDSVLIPVVLLLLTGGAVTSQIAAPGVAMAGIVILVVGASALTLLYYRYSR